MSHHNIIIPIISTTKLTEIDDPSLVPAVIFTACIVITCPACNLGKLYLNIVHAVTNWTN